MDYDQNPDQNQDSNQEPTVSASAGTAPKRPVSPNPPQPVPVYMSPSPAAAPRKPSVFRGIVKSLFVFMLIGSLILNIYLSAFLAMSRQQQIYRAGDDQNKIVLIDLQGAINMDTAAEMHQMFRRAEKDATVKGIILVVNSPGGQVAPSNMINQYVRDLKMNKKVYVAIEQVGASGAYWIAAAADKIYAQTNAVVGSIGVIYMNLVLEKTLKEKLGIEPIVIKSSESQFKDKGSPFRMPSDQERKEITEDLDTVHKRFVKVIAEGRPDLTEDEIWKLASGDVFDGPEAKEKKLIDEVGFLEDVVEGLAQDLNITDPQVVRFIKPPTIREMLTADAAGRDNPLNIQKQLEKWSMSPRIQALYLGR